MEAAEEISRQLRIRDLAGLVVIDFIDMLDRNHNYKVEKKLKEFVQGDRARIQIGRISNFGLLELSRQRLKVTEDQKISIKCSHCNGYGNVLSHEFLINQILRVWSEITYDKPKEKIYLLCNSLLNTKLNELKKMNKKDEIPLKTKIHDELGNQEFLICKENEVLIKNSHIDIEIESINEILRNKSYKDQNHDNRKTKNKNKLSEVVKNEVFETDGVVEDSKNEFEKEKVIELKQKILVNKR